MSETTSQAVFAAFEEWFLKKHGLLPQQAIDRIKEQDETIKQVRELPEKWKAGKEAVQLGFKSTTSQHYSAEDCANELKALIKGDSND